MTTPTRAFVLASAESFVRIAGVTVLERSLRTLYYEGVSGITVLCPKGEVPEGILSELKKFNIPFTVSPLDDGRRIDPSLLPADGTPQVLLLDGSALVDSRLPALLSQGGERLCFIPQECVPSRAGLPSITLSGRPYLFAGVAKISLSRLAGFALPSPLSLAQEAIEAVGDEPNLLLDLSTLPNYKPDMRAHVPFLFFPVKGPEDNPAAKSILISSSQKLVLDWPAWYIHRPIENALISQICEWSITPNQLTVLNNLAAFAALGLFAAGFLASGLVLALIVGVLDGLDGKQARVKLHFSPLGEWEHHLDKVYENGWYLALAWHLSAGGRVTLPLISLGTILAANVLDMVLTAAYRRVFHLQFDDSGPFARALRVFAGRRNTYLWTFAPFVLVGKPLLGFACIALYALLSLMIKGGGIMFSIFTRLRKVAP